MDFLKNFIIPPWAKWAAIAVGIIIIYGSGFVKGLDHAYAKVDKANVTLIGKQAKVTTKVITKYVHIRDKQDEVDSTIKKEGTAYAIDFSGDVYRFNNEYVRLFNESVSGISTLPSGEPEGSSGVTVSQSLEVGINNNIVARYWIDRAHSCEEWAAQEEKASQ